MSIRTDDWQGESLTESWKVTFADLMTLLVTFFILLLSMSALRQGVTDDGENPHWNTFGTPTGSGAVVGRTLDDAGIGAAGARISQIKLELGRAGLGSGYDIFHDLRGTVVRFSAPALADVDGLTESGSARLRGLAGYLSRSGATLEVTAVTGFNGPSGWGYAAELAEWFTAALVRAGASADQVLAAARVRPYADPMSGLYGGDRAGIVFVIKD